MKLNEKESGEYTLEEILEKYSSYVYKKASEFLIYLKNYGNHSLHIDIEDLQQVANIGVIKAYNNYNIEFTSEGYEDDNKSIGFFPYMKKTVNSQLRLLCRSILKTNSESYNIHEIQVSSLYEPASKEDNNDLELVDVIESTEKDRFEEYENKELLNELLSVLSLKEREVIEDYYFNDKKQHIIAKELGISRSYASRIIIKALKKMKKHNDKQLILEERGMNMPKVKAKLFDFNELSTFLINGAKEYNTLDEAVKAFCNKVENVSEEDIYLTLNKRKASYENIKTLYKKEETHASVVTIPTIDPTNYLKQNSVTSYKKEDIKPKTIEKEPKLNSLQNVKILNLAIEINGLTVQYTKDGVNLSGIKENLSIDDLLSLQETIKKVIEINNTIYK